MALSLPAHALTWFVGADRACQTLALGRVQKCWWLLPAWAPASWRLLDRLQRGPILAWCGEQRRGSGARADMHGQLHQGVC